ncbi:MAG: hypothetical protein ACRD6N_19430 [Pyrinomonadaceae bacterium]
MSCFLKRVLPFSLALALGVGLGQLTNHVKPTRVRLADATAAEFSVPPAIISVPELDLTEAANNLRGLGMISIRMQALFDADGSVKEVRPFPMLPYGVPEAAAGHGEFAGYTAMRVNNHFVKELPNGLTDIAIKEVQGIAFAPKELNGTAVPSRVTVLMSFNPGYYPRENSSFNEITLTVMDGSGVLWDDSVWVNREGLRKAY